MAVYLARRAQVCSVGVAAAYLRSHIMGISQSCGECVGFRKTPPVRVIITCLKADSLTDPLPQLSRPRRGRKAKQPAIPGPSGLMPGKETRKWVPMATPSFGEFTEVTRPTPLPITPSNPAQGEQCQRTNRHHLKPMERELPHIPLPPVGMTHITCTESHAASRRKTKRSKCTDVDAGTPVDLEALIREFERPDRKVKQKSTEKKKSTYIEKQEKRNAALANKKARQEEALAAKRFALREQKRIQRDQKRADEDMQYQKAIKNVRPSDVVEEEAIQARLAALGRRRVDTPHNGDCVFSSVAVQVNGDARELRTSACDIISQRGWAPEDYVARMRVEGEWGGYLEIAAMAFNLQRPIAVVQKGGVMVEATDQNDMPIYPGEPVYIVRSAAYETNSHYSATIDGAQEDPAPAQVVAAKTLR